MKKSLLGKSKNKKLTRLAITWFGVIALITIVVVNIVMWKNYFEKQSQLDVLKSEVQLINEQISQVAEPPTDLESKLEKAEDDLVIAQQVFPENVDRNDVVDFILITAEECDVQIMPLIFDGWGAGRAGQSYLVLRYYGTVIGKVSDATNFLTKLRNGDYTTIVITECTVERRSGPDISIPDDDIEVIIDLAIELYTSSVQAYEDTIA